MGKQPGSNRQQGARTPQNIQTMGINTEDPLANSNLSRTILQTNPGVERKTANQLSNLTKLNKKRNKTCEYRKKVFTNTFETRRTRRKELYDRLRPKLDPAARLSIDRFKEEHRRKEWAKLKKLETERQSEKHSKIGRGKKVHDNKDQHQNSVLDQTSDSAQDLSRRSSLRFRVSRSSSPGPTFTENPLASITRRDSNDVKRPEVVVTKVLKTEKTPTPSPRESEEKITAFMNLIPAPTPTRFIGKMHKWKADREKKETEGNISKPSSRRSSISPSTETIIEARETESALNIPKSSTSGFTTALRTVAKVKMGDLARKLKKDTREDSLKTSSTSGSSSANTQKQKEPGSPSSSRKPLPFPTKKEIKKTGGNALKMKGLISARKKQQETPSPVESGENTNRELKHRIFFLERNELTDDEVYENIGLEVVPKSLNPGFDEIVQVASMMNKLVIEKGTEKEKKETVLSDGGSNSLLYVGRLRSRINETIKEIPKEGELKTESVKRMLGNTKFLGRMTFMKDKHGLYPGSPDKGNDDIDELNATKDNPIHLALDKVKLKPQTSFDSSGHSRVVSRASHGSHKSNGGSADGENDKKIVDEEVVDVLQEGLALVRPLDIPEWNMHKHVRGDRELKPIFIPF